MKSYSRREPSANVKTIWKRFSVFRAPVTMPASIRSIMPSTSISVWMPRSRQPASCSERADRVRHAADADLEAGAVLDLGGDQRRHLAVDLAGLGVRELRQRLRRAPSITKSTSLACTDSSPPYT